jgi:pimeloyl-ACP methyl ester carboxylesterase
MSSLSKITPEGPGSVEGAPELPAGFTDTFSSRYIDTSEVRMHAVVGGSGPPLLLIHGWPETWYAWRLMMPALAEHFTVVAVDQRGIGLSDKPADGYDSATLAGDLVEVMDALGHSRFAVVGCDTGLLLAYAVAADNRDRVVRLAVGEAPLVGVAPSPPLFVPGPLNERLWHIAFNRTATINELLVRGREALFFGNEFALSAGSKALSVGAVNYYIDLLSDDADALRGSFALYRAIDTTIEQNAQRKTNKLTMPVLAMGGAESSGESIAASMRLAADDVQTLVLPCAHWLAELAPVEMVGALNEFLAPYSKEVA